MNRQRIKKCYISILLILSLTISMMLTACQKGQKDQDMKENGNNSQTENSTGGTQTVALQEGRYMEEKIEFPNTLKNLYDVKKKDGVIQVVFEGEPGSLYFYESSDQGKNWQSKIEIAAGGLPEGYRAADACIGNDGSVTISVGKMSVDAAAANFPIGKYEYYSFPADTQTPQPLNLNLPEGNESALEKGYGLTNLKMSEDQTLYGTLEVREGESHQYTVYGFNITDGSKKWEKKTAQGQFSLYGDRIYLNENGKNESDTGKSIKTLNAQTGEEMEDMVIPSGVLFMESVDLDETNQKMYYGNSEGIFAVDYGMTLQEKLVDGKITGLSEPGYNVYGLYMLSEKVFLVFMRNSQGEGVQVLRYEYDGEVSVQPTNQLTIYSLKENSVMDKMVFDFQNQNPDVLVNYEVGMKGQNITSVSDAVNILNTEIMAGKGPDVIVLNGLPWESYSEKGILKDVKQEVADLTGQEEFFTNLFSAYQKNDAQYAMPVSFKIPVILGKDSSVENINSLEGLVEAASQSGDIPAFYRRDQALLRYITSVCWDSVQEEGRISRDNLKRLLELTKAMNDQLKNYEVFNNMISDDWASDKTVDVFEADTLLDMFGIRDGLAAMDLGYLSYLKNYADIYNHQLTMGHVSENVFSPLLVGINAKTASEDLAKQFLNFILSAEEQGIFSGSSFPTMMNLPVNKNAFKNMTQKPSDEELAAQTEIYQAIGEEFVWPEETYFQQLETEITQLTTPSMEDSVVIDTVVECAWPYMNGEKDIETAVNEITQKLELYFAE
ncbi:MAG: carbohydrate ABC transporter substrate-binding protein [Clostridiales bacterium]|nr:carbohydrate ABC transporter substrate-binding protein [Clostridiales bacterium]